MLKKKDTLTQRHLFLKNYFVDLFEIQILLNKLQLNVQFKLI